MKALYNLREIISTNNVGKALHQHRKLVVRVTNN